MNVHEEYNRRFPFKTEADAEEVAKLYRKHSIGAIRYGDVFRVIKTETGYDIEQDVKAY